MTITLVANISANGKVLLSENKHHEAPPAAVSSFIQVAMQAGNMVLGRSTFAFIDQLPEAAKGFLNGLEVVLLSNTLQDTATYKVVNSPEAAIKYLQEKGFNNIAVGGGTKTYNAFLNEDLVTDIYFNIIPVITGNGGELGTNVNLEATFKLKEQQLLTDDIVQLHLTKAQ
ncbi:MAG: dihydrofolate reductase family protein [Chitinophaga sp.]|uniref:dihydrofolate reductase family protein n=1 Tax=Chitinophaga sp. TaxID=1869181 RepID=UPI001AFD4036|nr:dihydrofolate reductase [Chitinophaga sp.]MBO9728550.1 dihydrofolate reductase family protein [Chitinophaga sp.]